MNQRLQINKKETNNTKEKMGSSSETELMAPRSGGNVAEGERQSWSPLGISSFVQAGRSVHRLGDGWVTRVWIGGIG